MQISNLQKSFKKKQVLKDINLTTKPGQLIHIAGRNGSGKSTIFKIITGLLKADDGTVTLDNNTYIGALIENPGFLEYETGLSNLQFLANLRNNYDEEKVLQLLKFFYLDPNDQQAIKKYSIGMRQKIGIIQAVMEDQNLILFDEPTRGLDPDSINQFASLLNKLKEEGKTVIVASHDEIPEIPYTHFYKLSDGVLQNENQ